MFIVSICALEDTEEGKACCDDNQELSVGVRFNFSTTAWGILFKRAMDELVL